MNDIVIIGGGFAGVWAALTAAHETVNHDGAIDITLLSKDRYLTMRPRLYEKDPASLRVPLESVLGPVGVSLLEGAARAVDTPERTVAYDDADGGTGSLGYDRLIVATGSVQKELTVPGANGSTWNIDTYDAAVALDRHLQRVMQTPAAPGHATVVIVGAGFTGIELATEMRARLAEHGHPEAVAKARVVLVEQTDIVGPELGADARPAIEAALREANVETRLGARVAEIGSDGVNLDNGERIETVTTIVTTGLTANPLGRALSVELDELGRLPVDEMLRVEGLAGVYATGDIARAHVDAEHLALMSCQHAMRMGKFAGYNAAHELLGLPLRPYRQPDYVTCLDLGASGAVFTKGWDRQVEMNGAEAKALKRKINGEVIYPPQNDREAILAAAHIDARSRR
jgi:NADH dehydrogenase